MKYLKTYESMKEDFYKEMESLRKRENDIIQSIKDKVDEYMYDITDDYSSSPSEINVYRTQPDGEIEKKYISFFRYVCDESILSDPAALGEWFNISIRNPNSKFKQRVSVESLFSIQYKLSCDYSEDNGYRAYDKKDKLDKFIDDLESIIKRVKEIGGQGLEYRLKSRMLVSGTDIYHDMNYNDWIDINYLRGELAFRKEVNIYQMDKFGEDNIHSQPYSKLEIVLEFL